MNNEFKCYHISTPSKKGVYASISDTKKEVDALMIYLKRHLAEKNIIDMEVKIIASKKSLSTGELTYPHVHASVYGKKYSATVANLICDYLSKHHKSLYDENRNLRVYKKLHDNYEYLNEYLDAQAEYTRKHGFNNDFDKNDSEKGDDTESNIIEPYNNDYEKYDDYLTAVKIEKMQVILNCMKKESSMYLSVNGSEQLWEAELLDPIECNEIKKTI